MSVHVSECVCVCKEEFALIPSTMQYYGHQGSKEYQVFKGATLVSA